ncbi:MAG TPA: hypothetical protein VN661_00975 [Candidatus Acidoferrales bacterium]|nr:hypothetical protein [Candidatus Acidoferrales bacterium]
MTLNMRNMSARAVTAYALSETMPGPAAGRPGPQNVVYVDSAYLFRPLRGRVGAEFADPNQTAQYVIVPPEAPNKVYPTEASLLAVVFDDGSSAGDAQWVSAIIERRKARLQALQDVTKMLTDVQNGAEPVEQILGSLAEKANTLSTDEHGKAKTAWLAYHQSNGTAANPSPSVLMPLDWVRYEAALGIYQGTKINLQNAISSGKTTKMTQSLIHMYSQSISALETSSPALVVAKN